MITITEYLEDVARATNKFNDEQILNYLEYELNWDRGYIDPTLEFKESDFHNSYDNSICMRMNWKYRNGKNWYGMPKFGSSQIADIISGSSFIPLTMMANSEKVLFKIIRKRKEN